MIYTITFLKGSQSEGAETYKGPLDMAKAIAIAAVEKGSAERTEIHDVHKIRVFHYPRAAYAI